MNRRKELAELAGGEKGLEIRPKLCDKKWLFWESNWQGEGGVRGCRAGEGFSVGGVSTPDYGSWLGAGRGWLILYEQSPNAKGHLAPAPATWPDGSVTLLLAPHMVVG